MGTRYIQHIPVFMRNAGFISSTVLRLTGMNQTRRLLNSRSQAPKPQSSKVDPPGFMPPLLDASWKALREDGVLVHHRVKVAHGDLETSELNLLRSFEGRAAGYVAALRKIMAKTMAL